MTPRYLRRLLLSPLLLHHPLHSHLQERLRTMVSRRLLRQLRHRHRRRLRHRLRHITITRGFPHTRIIPAIPITIITPIILIHMCGLTPMRDGHPM